MTSLPPFTLSWKFLSFPLSWCQSPSPSSTQSYPDFAIEIVVRHPDPPCSSRNRVSRSGMHFPSFKEGWLLHPSGDCLWGDASPKVMPSACAGAEVRSLAPHPEFGTVKHGDLSWVPPCSLPESNLNLYYSSASTSTQFWFPHFYVLYLSAIPSQLDVHRFSSQTELISRNLSQKGSEVVLESRI